MANYLNRRRFNLLLGAGLAAGLAPVAARAAGTITVLNWQGYGTDEAWALKAFNEKTKTEVKHDYFSAEEEMLTKLRTNPGAYDVVLINSARTKQAVAEGLLEPIALNGVANAKDLAPALRDHPNFNEGGKVYAVAWVWGMNSIAVRRGSAVKTDSLAVLGDPSLANRVALFDDAVTAIGVGALLTGQDINNPKDLKAIAAKLREFKPNVKLFWSSEDQWNKTFSANEFDVSIYWSGAVARSQRQFNLPVDFIIPKEGAIGWLDGLSIPASSKNKEAARDFINYMIDPNFYLEWSNIGAPASANPAAMAKLPDQDLNRKIHQTEYLSKLQFMSPLPDERRTAFVELWQETKAFYAK